jgi:hypothetical protein
MKKKKRLMFIGVILLFSLMIKCDNQQDEANCHEIVKDHPGYEVWAGDTPYFQLADHYEYFYNIDKHGYTKIGETSTTTQYFETGAYKYYVIVAKYYACVDAIQFKDGSYYGDPRITGLTDWLIDGIFLLDGPADEKFGRLGWEEYCLGGTTVPSSFNGYITDSKTILSRGGGLTVIIGNLDCQNRTFPPI